MLRFERSSTTATVPVGGAEDLDAKLKGINVPHTAADLAAERLPLRELRDPSPLLVSHDTVS
jgi:hypothetical protein